MAQTRRRLLQRSLAGAVLLGAAGLVPVALRRTRVAPRSGALLRFFSPEEASIFAAVAGRVLAEESPGAPEPGLPGAEQLPPAVAAGLAELPRAPDPEQVDVTGRADAFLAQLDPDTGGELKRLLALLDSALFSLLGGGPPAPFTAQSPEQQDRLLARWAASRLAVQRSGYQALKRIACAMYFGAPEVFAALGYPGPPRELVETVNRARDAEAAGRGAAPAAEGGR